MAELRVGDEAVLIRRRDGVPVQHNSTANPRHGCRGRVLRVGDGWVEITSAGGPSIHRHDGRVVALPVEEARALYRAALEANPAWRSEEFIEQLVRDL